MIDRNNIEITKGSIIDIHQTVNGQNIFVILKIEPLVVVYGYDLTREYEYDAMELLDINNYSKEIEIIGNIYKLIGGLENG